MTPRQRVTIALNHEEPDLVPLDFGTGGNSSPVPEFYHKLLDYCGLAAEVRPLPHMLRLAVVDEQVLQSLAIDTRPIGMCSATRNRRPCDEPGCLYDDWGAKWRVVQAGGAAYNELAESPLADADLADLDQVDR